MVRGLHHHRPRRVIAGPAGSTGDLVELPGLQQTLARAVVLGQPGHDHRPDRHVDTDAEGVSAGYHLQQACLCQLFDKATVFGQHPGVVDSDSVTDEPGKGLAKTRGEPEPADQGGYRVFLLARAHVDRHERLSAFQGRRLGEVHNVDRGLMGG